MSKTYILAIDNGTQSVRALLFDLKGQSGGQVAGAFNAYFSDHPGWVEHDPSGFGNRCARPASACGPTTIFRKVQGAWRSPPSAAP
jgi:sugar (pentulose or hexulose) kinase